MHEAVTELQEDQSVKMFHKSMSTTEFWNQMSEIKYPEHGKTNGGTHLSFQ